LGVRRLHVSFVGSAASPAQFPRDGLPEVALLGRSNVGKSSLLNALCQTRGLARVSAQPGRTQLVNFFRVDNELYLTDLPGYGFARAPKNVRAGFEALITSYLLERAPLALCVALMDARHEPNDGDHLLIEWLEAHSLPYLIVATKADKLGRDELGKRLRALAAGIGVHATGVLATSAEKGTGLDVVWRAIRQTVEQHAKERAHHRPTAGEAEHAGD
jgi:GTP-binding protein